MRKQALCLIVFPVVLLGPWVSIVAGQGSAAQAPAGENDTYSAMTGLPEWMSIAAYAGFGYQQEKG